MRRAGGSLIVLFALYAIAAGAQAVRAQESELSAAPEQTAQQKSEQVAEQKSEPAPQQMSEQAAQQNSEQKSEQSSEHTTQLASQGKPESAAANASQQESSQGPKADLSAYEPGTIVVETSERRLHLILPDRDVLTYPVGVGKAGKSWVGTGAIAGKFIRPPWSPPRRLKLEKPWTPNYIPGGSPSNPMGAAAMTLNVDQYAIHGTNDPRSIGGFVSFGCIRMHNRDILDLYKRVKVGTRVVVLR